MPEIELKDEDYLQLAKALAGQNPTVALQVKCMALIRMLEESEARYTALEEKCQGLLAQEETDG